MICRDGDSKLLCISRTMSEQYGREARRQKVQSDRKLIRNQEFGMFEAQTCETGENEPAHFCHFG